MCGSLRLCFVVNDGALIKPTLFSRSLRTLFSRFVESKYVIFRSFHSSTMLLKLLLSLRHWMAGFIEKRDFMVHFTYYDPLVWSVFARFAVFISFHFAICTCLILFLGRTFFFPVGFNCRMYLLFYHFKCAPVLGSWSSGSFINMLLFAHSDMSVAVWFKRQQCALNK